MELNEQVRIFIDLICGRSENCESFSIAWKRSSAVRHKGTSVCLCGFVPETSLIENHSSFVQPRSFYKDIFYWSLAINWKSAKKQAFIQFFSAPGKQKLRTSNGKSFDWQFNRWIQRFRLTQVVKKKSVYFYWRCVWAIKQNRLL